MVDNNFVIALIHERMLGAHELSLEYLQHLLLPFSNINIIFDGGILLLCRTVLHDIILFELSWRTVQLHFWGSTEVKRHQKLLFLDGRNNFFLTFFATLFTAAFFSLLFKLIHARLLISFMHCYIFFLKNIKNVHFLSSCDFHTYILANVFHRLHLFHLTGRLRRKRVKTVQRIFQLF